MRLTRLRAADFRNLTFADVATDAPRVFLLGDNGQGKTNLLEAAGLVSAFRSFRTTEIAPLVRADLDISLTAIGFITAAIFLGAAVASTPAVAASPPAPEPPERRWWWGRAGTGPAPRRSVAGSGQRTRSRGCRRGRA